MNRRAKLLWIVAVSVVTSTAALAGSWWNPVPAVQGLFRKNRTDVLMICGNYARPRLLAELAQKKTGQPILLIASTREGGEELFLLPNNSEAISVAKNQFVDFVERINPKQVVFLGDGEYLAAEYVSALQGRFPAVILPGQDWDKTAQALANILDVGSRLPRRYGELLKVYDDAITRQPLAVAPVAEPEVSAIVAPTPPPTAETLATPEAAAAPATPVEGTVVVPAEEAQAPVEEPVMVPAEAK